MQRKLLWNNFVPAAFVPPGKGNNFRCRLVRITRAAIKIDYPTLNVNFITQIFSCLYLFAVLGGFIPCVNLS